MESPTVDQLLEGSVFSDGNIILSLKNESLRKVFFCTPGHIINS